MIQLGSCQFAIHTTTYAMHPACTLFTLYPVDCISVYTSLGHKVLTPALIMEINTVTSHTDNAGHIDCNHMTYTAHNE